MIQLYTGNGKGKTTAAFGTALRAVAKGMRVAIVYFDKGGTHYSERELMDNLRAIPPLSLRGVEGELLPQLGDIEYFPTGLDRIDPVTNKFRFGVTQEDKAEAERGLQIVRDLFAKNEYQLVVLDELNSTLFLKMFKLADVLTILDTKPKEMELIITGRGAPQELIDRADLVTEMKLVKHYFYNDILAREGIDY